MKKINLINLNQPIKISQKKHHDQRGFFQEIYLKKKLGLKLNFTAIAFST